MPSPKRPAKVVRKKPVRKAPRRQPTLIERLDSELVAKHTSTIDLPDEFKGKITTPKIALKPEVERSRAEPRQIIALEKLLVEFEMDNNRGYLPVPMWKEKPEGGFRQATVDEAMEQIKVYAGQRHRELSSMLTKADNPGTIKVGLYRRQIKAVWLWL